MISESRGLLNSGRSPCNLTSHPPYPRQGRLHLHTALRPLECRCTALQVLICFVHNSENTTMGVRLCTRTGLHRNRVGVTMPLEIALSPQARVTRFPPAPTQHWAYQAGTRGFIDMPFEGFLGPPWETADLTRILRRRLAKISIPLPF